MSLLTAILIIAPGILGTAYAVYSVMTDMDENGEPRERIL